MNILVMNYIGDRATDMKQGDKIYNMIIESFNKKENVHLDFSGMKTVLPTFLNNAIGTLYKDYTSEYLNSNLKIEHLCPDDLFILRRITKRAKEFYSDSQTISEVLNVEYSE